MYIYILFYNKTSVPNRCLVHHDPFIDIPMTHSRSGSWVHHLARCLSDS